MFECVVNVSEGRDVATLELLSRAAGASLRDRHRDRHHHRSVFTLINDPDPLLEDLHSLVGAAYKNVDLRRHQGVHPRFGVVDVVPFVALEPEDPAARIAACATRQPPGSPTPSRCRSSSTARSPTAPRGPCPRCAAGRSRPSRPTPGRRRLGDARRRRRGVRPILVAWNLWLHGVGLATAKELAASVRSPSVRSLAFEVGDDVQVSCNLVDVTATRPSEVYDAVAAQLSDGGVIERAELVGLAPRSLLEAEDPARWVELGLSADTTIEARLSQ